MVAPRRLSETLFDAPVRDVAEYLERTETRTMARIATAAQGLGESSCAATGLREHIRAHPLLATTAGALVGAVLGPALLRSLAGTRRANPALASHGATALAWALDTARRQVLARSQRIPPG
ncbi:MAG: hypothetical protein EPO68_17370 [Planctomycetota bacterium]|nr:MAG: hypothetical protein EPO68_17370 [Planctomycetota bacterium]